MCPYQTLFTQSSMSILGAPILGNQWPREVAHYAQVSTWRYSLVSYAFQMDILAKTSNSAALFAGV